MDMSATIKLFQSTPSVGRATLVILPIYSDELISIHALRGEGDIYSLLSVLVTFSISIHALRGEGDLEDYEYSIWHKFISIHALRGEGDNVFALKTIQFKVFQSTPSVGRATTSLLQDLS